MTGFPIVLLQVLTIKQHAHAIGWGETTHSLWINPVAFQQDVLPHYFPGIKKFASFTRKMNRYGFKKMIACRRGHQSKDIFYFRHDVFREGISPVTAKSIRIRHKRSFARLAICSALKSNTDGATSSVESPVVVPAFPGIPSQEPTLGEHSSCVLDPSASTILELVSKLYPNAAVPGILRHNIISNSALPSPNYCRRIYHAIHPDINRVCEAYGTGGLYSEVLTGGSLPRILPSAMTNVLGSRQVLVPSTTCSGSGCGGRICIKGIFPVLERGSPDTFLRNLVPYTSRISGSSIHSWDAAMSLRMHLLGE